MFIQFKEKSHEPLILKRLLDWTLRNCPKIKSVNGWAILVIAPTEKNCPVGANLATMPVGACIWSRSVRPVKKELSDIPKSGSDPAR